MAISSPRLRRLDNALASLPPESGAMMLSELDGYLAGVIICPEPIAPEEWLPPIWGGQDGELPFEDEREAKWYADLVTAHHDAVLAALRKGAGRYRPFLEVDVARGEILWEMWIDGFAAAMSLRPEGWSELAEGDDAEAAEATNGLATLIEIADDESSLERADIDALTDQAPQSIPRWIEILAARRASARQDGASDVPAQMRGIGRNDPCPCGSGAKHKRCCGRDRDMAA